MKTNIDDANDQGEAHPALLLVVGMLLFLPAVSSAKPRSPLPLLPEPVLNTWRFDGSDWWLAPRRVPVALENILCSALDIRLARPPA